MSSKRIIVMPIKSDEYTLYTTLSFKNNPSYILCPPHVVPIQGIQVFVFQPTICCFAFPSYKFNDKPSMIVHILIKQTDIFRRTIFMVHKCTDI